MHIYIIKRIETSHLPQQVDEEAVDCQCCLLGPMHKTFFIGAIACNRTDAT